MAADPEAAGARADLARALQALGDTDAALVEWRALVGRPGATAEHMVEAVGVAFRAGRFDEALAMLDAGSVAHPASAAISAARGAVLYAIGRADEAIASYESARRLAGPQGDPGDLFVDHAIALCALGRTREGAELLLTRLPRAPVVRGHQQLATAALALGDFAIGWPQLEHRWLEGPVAAVRPSHALPPWKGQALHGKTLLVRAEQGIGDTIQFSRYLPMLRERGARTLFVPLEGMEAFATRFAGIDRCVGRDVDVRGIDFYIDLMSIPGVVGTTLETIPPVAPPGPAPGSVRARWAARMRGLSGRRIGLVWAGRPEHPRDRERSIPFERLAPLFAIAGLQWVSLQKGAPARQAAAERRPATFVDLDPELATLDDTAEAILHLDLVVSVDTSVAHLAATLGKPVWMLVPTPADCRWLEDRNDSPWYPGMRLFRQSAAGHWGDPIEQLARALRAFAESGEPAQGAPLARAARAPLSLPRSDAPLAVVTDSRCGLVQVLPDGSDDASSLERYGEWRADELALAIAFAVPGGVCIEAGSSFGQHAIPLARKLGPEGDLLAWEDRSVRRRILVNNLRHHGLDQVTVMSRSLGRGGEGAFQSGLESIDDLALERLDGIKVNGPADAEAIVEGAGQTLWRCRPGCSRASTGTTTCGRSPRGSASTAIAPGGSRRRSSRPRISAATSTTCSTAAGRLRSSRCPKSATIPSFPAERSNGPREFAPPRTPLGMGIFRRFREAVTSARRNADGDAAAAARAAGAEAPSPGERWPVGLPAFDAAREAYVRTAIAMRREGDLRGAAALLESELPGRPNAIGYYLLGETLLTLGDYRRGWPLLEFRWLHPALVGKRAYYGRPPWIGQDLRGRTVLVQVEQGIGDVIMFVRYLPWLKRLGARVLLVPRVDMATVARRLPGVDQVLDDGAPLPEFDFVVHLMSLPRVFGTTIDTVPDEVPYLAPDASRVARLAPSLGDDGPPRIGIVWAGRPTPSHNALRSIPLPMLRPLLMTPGCRFYSLQKGPAEAELAALPAGTPIVPLGGEFEDLDDLVAAISRMDLVISVCTGPAHLAGAMGKPVWTMIAEPRPSLAHDARRQPVVPDDAPVPAIGARRLGWRRRPRDARAGARTDGMGGSGGAPVRPGGCCARRPSAASRTRGALPRHGRARRNAPGPPDVRPGPGPHRPIDPPRR
ncbi:MAG: glycosyltransferase family 9 protein [Burkholderiales bacterium]